MSECILSFLTPSHILGVISNQDRLYFSDLKNNVLSQEVSPSYADAITCIQSGE